MDVMAGVSPVTITLENADTNETIVIISPWAELGSESGFETLSFDDGGSIRAITLGEIYTQKAGYVGAKTMPNEYGITARGTEEDDVIAATGFDGSYPLPISVISARLEGFDVAEELEALVTDDGQVRTLLLSSNVGLFARYSSQWIQVFDENAIDGLRAVAVQDSAIDLYDSVDSAGEILMLESLPTSEPAGKPTPTYQVAPLGEPGTEPATPVVAPAVVSSAMVELPIINAAADITPEILERADDDDELRWYVEARARALHVDLPESLQAAAKKRMEEDETPNKSPYGAVLKDYSGGKATYKDGSTYDGSTWQDSHGKTINGPAKSGGGGGGGGGGGQRTNKRGEKQGGGNPYHADDSGQFTTEKGKGKSENDGVNKGAGGGGGKRADAPKEKPEFDEETLAFFGWFSKLSDKEKADFEKAFGVGNDKDGKPQKRTSAPRIEEDDSPLKSPSGAKLVDYDGAGSGLAVYEDGTTYDGYGWRDKNGKPTGGSSGKPASDDKADAAKTKAAKAAEKAARDEETNKKKIRSGGKIAYEDDAPVESPYGAKSTDFVADGKGGAVAVYADGTTWDESGWRDSKGKPISAPTGKRHRDD